MGRKGKHLQIFLAAVVLYALLSNVSHAALASASLNISLTIASLANLTLGATALRFIADDPALQPTVPALENPVSALARVRSRGTPSLIVIASDDLKDGADTIPVSALTWTADGAPFIGGTMNKASGQSAAALPSGSGAYQSAFRYFLANSTLYAPGAYSTTINYTLTAP